MEEIVSFEYLVQSKAKQNVSFGTSRNRDTSTLGSKFNRLAAEYQPEIFPNISPCSYFLEKRDKKSEPVNRGPQALRFKRVVKEGPSPDCYELQRFPEPVCEAKAPFSIRTPRLKTTSKSSVPGLGTYSLKDDFIHQLDYYQNFGSRRIKVKPPSKIEELHNKCGICGALPLDYGEAFWKKVTDDDLADVICCGCMKKLQRDAPDNLKKTSFMRKYKLKCECPYYHWHAGMPRHRVINAGKIHDLPREARFYQHLHILKEEEKDETIDGFTREVYDVIAEDLLSGFSAEKRKSSVDG